MNINYLKAADKLRYAMSDIDKLIESAPHDTFEDKKAYSILLNEKERLETTIGWIDHYSKPTKEGYLYELDNGKFTMDGISYNFSCGSSIEVYDSESRQWYSGRVEHTDGHYYFYNGDLDNPVLYSGMKVRVRIEQD